jgi:1-acyl-sn-glycerol-3-phosphate acyltransferase
MIVPSDPFDPPLVFAMGRWFCHFVLRTFFHYRVLREEYVPKSGPCLIVSNHCSFLDPPAVAVGARRCTYSFARKTLFQSGLRGWMFRRFLTIPVDREGGKDSTAIRTVLRLLQLDQSILLFPEGTRSPDGQLQPAKRGIGLIAVRSRVPVVPARVFGSYEAWNRHWSKPRWGTPVTVAFGPPLLPADYDPGESAPDRYQAIADRFMEAIGAITLS